MRQASHLRRRGLQVVRLLAVLVCIAAVVHFGYNAFLRADHSYSYPDPITGEQKTTSADELSPYLVPRSNDDIRLAFDAGIAMLAATAVLVTSLNLFKSSRRTKRLVLGIAAVLVTPFVVCSFLLVLSLWMH